MTFDELFANCGHLKYYPIEIYPTAQITGPLRNLAIREYHDQVNVEQVKFKEDLREAVEDYLAQKIDDELFRAIYNEAIKIGKITTFYQVAFEARSICAIINIALSTMVGMEVT